MNRIVAVVGPTAVGKSSLAIELATRFNGEIIGADSRQVYRYMDIGTAKPTPHERTLVPHHLVDIIDPDEEFSLTLYQKKAYDAIKEIHVRKQLPFLVGGTGLYIRAVLEGWQAPAVSPDPKFRYNMEIQAKTESGRDELYEHLCSIDPDAAAIIDRRNIRRVIRALEVYARTGKPFSQSGGKQPPAFNKYIIGLTASRAVLYQMADMRVEGMIENGFIEEVRRLVDMGYSLDLPSMSSIGYRQIGQFVKGELSLEEAVQAIKTHTHRYIRHQYAWFRPGDGDIHWYDRENSDSREIADDLAAFLAE